MTAPVRVTGVVRTVLEQADRTHAVVGLTILACVPVVTGLALIDNRTLDGSNVWLKPLKFQISVGVFLLTLALMMPLAGVRFRRSWLGRSTVWVAVVTSVFEIAWITLRAGLGDRSHYATGTAFGGFMYVLMGVAAVLLSLTPVAVAIGAMRTKYRQTSLRTVRLGLTLGAAVGFLGAAGVGLLLGGSPDHYPIDRQDEASRIPLVGWSVERGDLRIAHFVGLHAIQGLFVMGLVLVRTPPRWARAILLVAALAWLAAVAGLAALATDGDSPFAQLGLPPA